MNTGDMTSIRSMRPEEEPAAWAPEPDHGAGDRWGARFPAGHTDLASLFAAGPLRQLDDFGERRNLVETVELLRPEGHPLGGAKGLDFPVA